MAQAAELECLLGIHISNFGCVLTSGGGKAPAGFGKTSDVQKSVKGYGCAESSVLASFVQDGVIRSPKDARWRGVLS